MDTDGGWRWTGELARYFDRNRPKLVESGQSMVEIRPHISSTSTKSRRTRAHSGRVRAKFGRVRAEVGHIRFGRNRIELGRIRPILTECRPSLCRIRAKFGPDLAGVAQIRSNSVHAWVGSGRNWSDRAISGRCAIQGIATKTEHDLDRQLGATWPGDSDGTRARCNAGF